MLPFFTEEYGNASTVYEPGVRSRNALRHAREDSASLIGADRDEIFFTSGGSESDNWALKGLAEMAQEHASGAGRTAGYQRFSLITTKIEHHAVLNTALWLQERGAEVHLLDTDQDGCISLQELGRVLADEEGKREKSGGETLVSVMMANNEIGTLEPVAEAAALAHAHGAIFHTDAVQAFGQIPVNVKKMGIDLLSASSHKIYGPKGVGLLYVRKGILLPPLIHGGGQERGRRAGTENVPGIVGFAAACRAAGQEMNERAAQEQKLRGRLVTRVLSEIPGTALNGPGLAERGEDTAENRGAESVQRGCGRLPGNANIRFDGIEGETLLTLLDMQGICASSGSACSSGSIDPSHVLKAIGLDLAQARSSLRFTIGAYNTMEEIDETVEVLKRSVSRLRGHLA